MNAADAHLFLVSTPLHLMVALAITDVERLQNAHLVFIDQVAGKANPYLAVLEEWAESPFTSLHVFFRPQRSALKKLAHRKQTFAQLAELVEHIRPAHIYVGNDRRIEFQYCMHRAAEQGRPAIGYYIDEGMFTYVGRAASGTFSDRVLDNFLKKLSYGRWWKHPPTVGGSAWVKVVYAAYPELIHPLLKRKTIRHLSLAYWQCPLLKHFCHLLIGHLVGELRLAQYGLIVTLPHESILQARPELGEKVTALIQSALQQDGRHVGVKYHPRDTQADALGLSALDRVDLLPLQIPFEAMLPMLPAGAQVVGDFSTTLITTRLLRPDIAVRAMTSPNKKQAVYTELYRNLGIHFV